MQWFKVGTSGRQQRISRRGRNSAKGIQRWLKNKEGKRKGRGLREIQGVQRTRGIREEGGFLRELEVPQRSKGGDKIRQVKLGKGQ